MNLVLQEDEIIRWNVKDHISGSYLTFTGSMKDAKTNETVPLDGDLLKLTRPYHSVTGIDFEVTENSTPMHDATKLITVQVRDSRERTYLFYISETYHVFVLDFTDRKNSKIYKKVDIDLMPIIANYVGPFTIRELFCNELETVWKDELFLLACAGRGRKFMMYFRITPTSSSLSLDIFGKATEYAQIDRIGRNSMIVLPYKDFAFLLSSAVDTKQCFTLTILDLKHVNDHYVGEQFYGRYYRSNFTFVEDGKLKFLEKVFNIRDIKLYSTVPDNSTENGKEQPQLVHNIIISCFNNGLLFFQAKPRTDPEKIQATLQKNLNNNEIDPNNSNDYPLLMELTHRMNLIEPGRLFTYKEYYSINEIPLPFKIFVTHVAPASVYELSINEHFNVNIVRSYMVPLEAESKFIGKDVLSVNK